MQQLQAALSRCRIGQPARESLRFAVVAELLDLRRHEVSI
jgi:hypothetical protein